MDWFSWLSKTTIHPSLIYEYGLVFTRNELQKEDIVYFNHDLLNNLGVTIAKHRLEILKLVNIEVSDVTTLHTTTTTCSSKSYSSFSKLFRAMQKSRKMFTKYLTKLGLRENRHVIDVSNGFEEERIEMEKRVMKSKERRITKSGPIEYGTCRSSRRSMLSRPLDTNVQERLVLTYRRPAFSGPIDGGKVVHGERMMVAKRPNLSGPLRGRSASPRVYRDYKKDKLGDEDTLWATLFQDMKPT